MKSRLFLLVSVCIALFTACSDENEVVVVSHPNGKPAYVEYFKKNDTINPVRTMRYYYDGEKQEEIHYKDGVKNGEMTFWYQNGEKMMMGTYKNGALNGTFTQWFDNGKVDYIAEYTNGRPSGTWKYYSADGKLLSEQKMQ